MKQYLKISVVMPSYNQGRFLEKSMMSVIAQNYPTLEFIIIDGGSTDNSIDLIRKYEAHLHHWQSKPDKGQSDAINQGMEIAKGDILCWLNSDDLHEENTLATVNSYFCEHQECDWLIGAGQFVDPKGRPMWPVQLPSKVTSASMANWYRNNMFHQPSVFWRRALWQKAGPLREDFNLGMDVELWLRFLKISKPHVVPSLLSVATDHADMKTRRALERSYAELCQALFINGYHEEGRLAVEQIAKRAFYLKRLAYPFRQLVPIRKLIYSFFQLKSRNQHFKA